MRALHAILNNPWCITEDALKTIVSIAKRENPSLEALESQTGRKLEYTRQVTERGGVATIPIEGPIFRKANLFTSMSGATSLEVLAKDFTAALNNPQIRAILFSIDSPGGEVTGVNEFADLIYQSRGQKPIVAYVEGMGASAAYWLASACDSIVCEATAMVGSIGVIAAMDGAEDPDQIVFVSTQSPNKHPDPKSEAGSVQIQTLIDATADVFIGAVARNRGVRRATVLERYGAGGVFVGKAAVDAGLADKLGSYESVLASLQGREGPKGGTFKAGAAFPLSTHDPSQELVTITPLAAAQKLHAAELLAMAPPASRPARPYTHTPKEIPMSDETPVVEADVELSAAEQARIDRIVAMRTQEAREAEARVLAAAEARFERLMAEERTRTQVESYAQHITTPTLSRQHALPGQAAAYSALLLSLNADQRKAATSIFDNILTAGLVSFEEIGSGGEGESTRNAIAEWDTAILAKTGKGMARSAAIAAVQRENPELYRDYNTQKGGK